MDLKTRRSCAFVALESYLEAKDEEQTDNTADRTDQIVDLIADLFHLADHELSADIPEIARRAQFHFMAEKDEAGL